jgi:predicted AAA+ superfamily ATPase
LAEAVAIREDGLARVVRQTNRIEKRFWRLIAGELDKGASVNVVSKLTGISRGTITKYVSELGKE